MIALILFFTVFVPYLIQGARYSRSRYAEINHANHNPDDFKKIAALEAESKRLVSAIHDSMATTRHSEIAKYHKANCEKSIYNHVGSCTCGHVSNAKKALEKVNSELFGRVDEPGVVMPMLLWPGFKTVDYLKGGTVRKPNYSVIAELESENGLDSLE